MHMKIEHAKILTVLLVFTMLLSVFSPSVFAEEAPGFELPVSVSVSGTPPTTDNEYIIILEADNPNYPMPKDSKGGRYHLSMSGYSTSKFPKIEFPSLGVYTYKIYQSPMTDKSYGYDGRVYNLIVYVTNAEDGSGLEITVILYLTGQTKKLDQVVFKPETPEEPEDPETPGDPEDPQIPVKPEDPHTPEEPDDPQIPIEPENPQIPEDWDHPKTSDDTELMPYLLLLISGIALLFIFVMTKKKKENED